MPTIALGKSLYGACGLSFSVSKGISIDKNGNISKFKSGSLGAGTIGISYGPVLSIYDVEKCSDLNGFSVQYGASVGNGISAGLDQSFGIAENCQGVNINVAASIYGPIPGELHATVGYTKISDTINIFDVAESYYTKIESW